MITTLTLCAAAFVAGLIDSVVGGGGLVQLPALFIAYPQAPAALLLGTNRISSIFGTATAMLRYARETAVPWRTMLPTAAVAAATSLLGAWTVTHVSNVAFKPLVLVILVLVALYTLRNKKLGQNHAPRLSEGRQQLAGALIGAVLGFYDGFMGPGTGSFLLFAFVGVLGFSFLSASASAKVINVATNATSLAFFLYSGLVLLPLGLLMAGCNVLGSIVGTRLALRHGSGFVRKLFLIVVPLVIARFAYDIAQTWLR